MSFEYFLLGNFYENRGIRHVHVKRFSEIIRLPRRYIKTRKTNYFLVLEMANGDLIIHPVPPSEEAWLARTLARAAQEHDIKIHMYNHHNTFWRYLRKTRLRNKIKR